MCLLLSSNLGRLTQAEKLNHIFMPEVLHTFHLLMKTVRLSAPSSAGRFLRPQIDPPFISSLLRVLISYSRILLTFDLSRWPPEACVHPFMYLD